MPIISAAALYSMAAGKRLRLSIRCWSTTRPVRRCFSTAARPILHRGRRRVVQLQLSVTREPHETHLESGPWHGGAVHSPAVRVCAIRPHCPGQCSAHRPADRAGAAVSRRTHRRCRHRQRRFQHHTVGHWQRIGGAGSPDRERPAHQPVLGLSFGIGHANRRPSDPWAGPLLAAAQRAGSTAHPAGCRAVCPQLSGLL